MVEAGAHDRREGSEGRRTVGAEGRSRRRRLDAARLYLVCDTRPGGRELEQVLPAAIRGGVDVVQLREKSLDGKELLAAARRTVVLCREHGALSIINDLPDLALRAGADGVHVGQEDAPPATVRSQVGPELLVGLSTHAQPEVDAAGASGLVDYIGVGPVHATPTKPGRPAVGAKLVAHAARASTLPFFAIGGIDAGNVGAVLAAGAKRICVLRAIAEAPDPEGAAATLCALLAR
jgi:thiamine-phosphate pyrophosphorylase